MQEFTIETLIDITETGRKRKEQGFELEYQQQQNFSMLLQTIGMRVNPQYNSAPKFKTVDVSNLNFGSVYKGKHTVWTFNFFIEFNGGFTDNSGNPCGLLEEDLNFVPVICSLLETAQFPLCVFDTKSNENRNTTITLTSDK